MSLIRSQVKTSSDVFRRRYQANLALNEELAQKLETVRKGVDRVKRCGNVSLLARRLRHAALRAGLR